jgi:hypothetical protein
MPTELPLAGRGARMSAGLGLRAVKGGAVAVGVSVDAGPPRILVSTFIKTCADGDRLSLEPYGVAHELASGPQGVSAAAAAAAEGRRRQDALAAQALQDLIGRLEEAGGAPIVAALLVNRAGWITDLLEYSLAFADHVPVAEGLAVREALRFAFRHCAIGAAELDEKSLPDVAAARLGMSAAEIEARLKALGATAGKPWRREQKLACLAAWLAVAERS